MREMISKRISELSRELESLTEERRVLSKRVEDIEVRLHQLVGAIYELQSILTQVDQPSETHELSREARE